MLMQEGLLGCEAAGHQMLKMPPRSRLQPRGHLRLGGRCCPCWYQPTNTRPPYGPVGRNTRTYQEKVWLHDLGQLTLASHFAAAKAAAVMLGAQLVRAVVAKGFSFSTKSVVVASSLEPL